MSGGAISSLHLTNGLRGSTFDASIIDSKAAAWVHITSTKPRATADELKWAPPPRSRSAPAAVTRVDHGIWHISEIKACSEYDIWNGTCCIVSPLVRNTRLSGPRPRMGMAKLPMGPPVDPATAAAKPVSYWGEGAHPPVAKPQYCTDADSEDTPPDIRDCAEDIDEQWDPAYATFYSFNRAEQNSLRLIKSRGGIPSVPVPPLRSEVVMARVLENITKARERNRNEVFWKSMSDGRFLCGPEAELRKLYPECFL